MRIRNLLTVTSPRVHAGLKAQRERWADPGVTIEVVALSRGPYSLEFAAEEVVAGPHILEAVVQAEKDGVDAVIPECMLDPVLRAARELVRIPVVGPGKAGLAFATSLGSRVAILGVCNGQSILEEHVRAYGFSDLICAYKTVDAPPADLAEASPYVFELMARESRAAMSEARADVILLGCTAMSAFASHLKQEIGLPVVEPSSCAIRMAIDLVRLGLSHSKRCYPTPPERPMAPGSISVWQASGLPAA